MHELRCIIRRLKAEASVEQPRAGCSERQPEPAEARLKRIHLPTHPDMRSHKGSLATVRTTFGKESRSARVEAQERDFAAMIGVAQPDRS